MSKSRVSDSVVSEVGDQASSDVIQTTQELLKSYVGLQSQIYTVWARVGFTLLVASISINLAFSIVPALVPHYPWGGAIANILLCFAIASHLLGNLKAKRFPTFSELQKLSDSITARDYSATTTYPNASGLLTSIKAIKEASQPAAREEYESRN